MSCILHHSRTKEICRCYEFDVITTFGEFCGLDFQVFGRSPKFKFLKQNCVLNDKSNPSTFACFFVPIFVYYAVIRWSFGADFSLRLVSWMAAICMLFFCNQSMMSSFLFETITIQNVRWIENVEVLLRVGKLWLVFASIILHQEMRLQSNFFQCFLGLQVGAIQEYPSSAATPYTVMIPVATAKNSTKRWAGVCFNVTEDEKMQGNYAFPSQMHTRDQREWACLIPPQKPVSRTL